MHALFLIMLQAYIPKPKHSSKVKAYVPNTMHLQIKHTTHTHQI